MSRTQSNTHSRRCIALLCLVLTPLAPMAAHAADIDEFNPVDRLPRYFSEEKFEKLDKNQLYMLKLAVRQNLTFKIGDSTPSQSREMIENAPLRFD